jgi:hypothetical protein
MENTTNKPFFGRFLRNFLELLFLIVLIVVFFGAGGEKILEEKIRQYIGTQDQPIEKKPLPEPSDPVEMAYEWKYNGQKYSIKETLFSSYYNFYSTLPKTYSYQEGELAQNWEEEYFGMFLGYPIEDKTIPELAVKIKELGTKNNLSDDQIVELALSFVQNIPYDEIKAKRILSGNNLSQSEDAENAPDYPYEVLYKKLGVCSDKSLLAYSLIKELGYGVAVFVYDAENHMSIGIKCPQNYSTYNSGYCYAETTNPGNKIGFVPELDVADNKAASAKEIELFGDNQNTSSNSKIIGEARIINKIDGEVYGGVVQTVATQGKISELKAFLSQEKKSLDAMRTTLLNSQNKIAEKKNSMDKLLAKDNYAEYNDLVPEYNEKIASYQKDLKKYNARIKNYNTKVKEYNSLIKSFYQT